MPPEPQGKAELRATRRAFERRGMVITEDLDTHFKQARLANQQQALSRSMEGLVGGSTGMVRRAGAQFPGHFTPTSKYGGTIRRAQSGASVDRVFDVPYNPFRNRVAVETPKNDKERRARYRYYAQYDPYVGAAIDLHSEFPLSDFELTHEDDHLRNEFNDIADDINLFEFILDLAHEYWMVGEAFPFGFFDDPADPCEWTKFILLNPDLVKVIHHEMMQGKHSSEMFLQLDSVVTNIVQRGPYDPETKNAFHRLPEDVIQYARQGRPMPLSPIQVSQFRRKGSNSFGSRGESMMSRVLHILSYRDKLRDAQYTIADRHVCYDKETECLTKDGWKKYFELTFEDDIATFNKGTGALEYQKPEGFYINHYKGDMIHFGGTDTDKRIDVMVTPDHRMLVQDKKCLGRYPGKKYYKYGYTDEWKVVKSQDVRRFAKFRACVDSFEGEMDKEVVEIGDRIFHIDDYLQMIGWYLSEGGWWQWSENAFAVSVSQVVGSEHISECRQLFGKLGFRSSINNQGCEIFSLSGKPLAIHFNAFLGHRCENKKIPDWVRNLPREKLRILVDTMVKGDGHDQRTAKWKDKTYERRYIQYFTTSKQLADDLQDVVFKLGYVPTIKPKWTHTSKKQGYTIQWSETSEIGKFPVVGLHGKPVSRRVPYDDTIWCVMVPNTFFATRRNGKVLLNGNTPKEFYLIGSEAEPADQAEIESFADLIAQSWLDPNLAIVWHHAVNIQWMGAEGRILPLRHEIEQIDRELMAALMLNKAFIHGEGPTYANSSVALDVLISRYIQFRQRIERWMRDMVWAPLCRIHGIYKPTDAELSHRIRVKGAAKKPWTPEVAWSKYELRDNYQKVQLFERLVASGMLPPDYLYHSLNLNPTQVRNKLKKERERQAKEGPPTMPPTGAPAPGRAPGMPPLGGPGGAPGGGAAPPRPEEMALPGVGPVRLPTSPPDVGIPGPPRQRPQESSRPTALPTG